MTAFICRDTIAEVLPQLSLLPPPSPLSFLPVLVAALYFVCFVLLGGLGLLIFFQSHWKPNRRFWRVRRAFLFLSVSLILWQLTLFLESHTALPVLQLYLGRSNFTAIVFVVYFAFRLVQEVDRAYRKRYDDISVAQKKVSWFLLGQTLLFAVVTLLTPLVSKEESVIVGSYGIAHPVTRFGSLFPLYLLHVFGYWIAAIGTAFWRSCKSQKLGRKRQLTLIGVGMALTGAIAAVTNAYLPYAYDDFRFCQVGTLATFFFIAAIAYAVFIHNLFDLKIVLRETVVFGILLTVVMGAYSSAIFLITQFLTEGAGKSSQFVVLLLAFSFDPLRRYLEKKTDRFLFGQEADEVKKVRYSARRSRERRGRGRDNSRES